MSLKSSNKIEANKYELEVSVDAATFEKAISAAYMKARKNITVPGFRKGKAPRKMIEKLYGEGVFFEDAINELYPVELSKAVEEANLDLVDRPEVDVVSISKEEGVELKAICTVKPEVEISDYKGIKVEKVVNDVTDETVDAEIQKLIERNGRLVSIDDRAAQNGDDVVIDFEGFVDGVAFEGGKAEKFNLSLGSGQFIPGFEDQVVGHSIDEEFDVNVTFPEEYQSEELAGKAAVFKIKLHEIKAKELPTLDDEFVKDATEFDTVDELKADFKAKLTEAASNKADSEVEAKLMDEVISKMTVEVPQCMFDHRIDDMVRDFDYRLKSQGMGIDLYLQYTGMDMEGFRKTFEEQAEKQVKLRLALEKIAEIENFEASENEVEEQYASMAEQYSMDIEKVKAIVSADDLKKDIVVNKAVELIKSSAEIK